MHFEAKLRKQKYEVIVTPTSSHWVVGVKKGADDWKEYRIRKKDFEEADNVISFVFNESSYLVDVVGDGTDYSVYTRGSYRKVNIFNDEILLHQSLKTGGSLGSDDALTSGMPGKIVAVHVKKGQKVKEGDPLVIMEAMKMENEMKASAELTIKDVHVKAGDNVDTGTKLISFEPQSV
jgi:acetyl/propionyl-CoA carboxylase alpha subunit